jgi:MraZ protein
MAHFLGNHQNKLDAKGRVSIPAPFRNALKLLSRDGSTATGVPLVLRPSHKHPCIEGWPEQEFAALAQPLENYDEYSDDHDDLAITLYSDAFELETDKEGRIVLPAELATYAGLSEAVVFMGVGKRFEIWEPEAAARRRAAARERTRDLQLTLRTTAQ